MRFVFALAALVLAASPSASAELAAGGRSAGDGWTVQVSVEPSDLGRIVVSVARVRRVQERDRRVWLQHDLVFENTSDRRITFAETRTAAVLGPPGRPMLVASDQACGYYRIKPLRGACLLYLDFPTVRPHGSVSRTVTLWKGLPGMRPLAAGAYVFRKPLRFQVGREVPAKGSGRTVTIELVYRVAVS
ncbi:MAG: hypothetical protein ACRDNC_06875 [Gaiellaceae bacterium]